MCERDERDIDGLPVMSAPTRDQAHNLGVCPDLNQNGDPLLCEMTTD